MRKTNRKITEVSYWESMADNMVALLLLILLIMMLLMLYLVRIKNDDKIDDYLGTTYEHNTDVGDWEDHDTNDRIDDEAGDTYDDDNGGGGGSGWVEEHPYDDPDPGYGIGEGEDRAAVYVRVLDGETERTIKKEGITFELYDEYDKLQILSTYYPKKISYKQYRTDENGVFYLPERIIPDKYYLHCITEVPGYDTSEDTHFEIDKAYFWDDPFIVDVWLYPSKNVIEIHLMDITDGTPLGDASFDVIAAEDITTADGTVRYEANSVVDTIVIDENGIGRSKELYLGNYLLRQVTVPEYYGKIEKYELVTLKGRTVDKHEQVVEIEQQKTSIEIIMVDALYDTQVLPGGEFTLLSEDGVVLERFTANEQGSLYIENLTKNTTYRIRQELAADGYQIMSEDFEFHVTGDGWINGTVGAVETVQNRMIRISIGVKDKLLRDYITDVNLALLDMNGNVVRTWTSTGVVQLVESVNTGEYQLVVDGDREKAETITVKDMSDIQEFILEQWTWIDTLLLIFGCLIITIILAFLIFIIVKTGKNRKKAHREESIQKHVFKMDSPNSVNHESASSENDESDLPKNGGDQV